VVESSDPAGAAAASAAALVRDAILRETGLLDTEELHSLRAVAELAAWICGTPMGAVSLVDENRQFFAGSLGLPVRQTDRESSFCAVAMEDAGEPMLVPDARADERFATNALVTGPLGLRSYAGVPLVAPEGVALGAVCALGDTTMDLAAGQVEALQGLAAVTVELLEARRTATRLAAALTEITAADAAARASREQFQTVFAHAPLGMTLIALDGRYLQVNAAFATLLGWTPEELAGRGSWEVTAAEDAEQDAASVRDLLERGSGSRLREKRYRHRDGSLLPALVTTSLIRTEGGGPPVLLNQVESIAARRAAEARLLEVQSAHDGIISMDATGHVTSWNLGAERLLGYPAALMLGGTLERVIPADQFEAHLAGVDRVAAGGAPHLLGGTVELPAIRADGVRILVELALSSWSQQGEVGFTGVLRDVTARRRSETLAELVRSAATTANEAHTLAEGADVVLHDVCLRLGWVAAHAWTDDGQPAIWAMREHAHADPGGCGLERLAGVGDAPSQGDLPVDAQTRIALDLTAMPDTGIRELLAGCGVGAAVAVPVLVGGEAAGMLAFYLPDGAELGDPELTTALEQVGVLLGRVAERERTATLLRHQADHDPLTDLANRRLLLREISALQTAQAQGQAQGAGALLLLDLDRFRLVNESMGHTAGDVVLQEVAARLRRAAQDSDIVARLSSDEFAVLVRDLAPASEPGADPLVAAGERLLEALCGPILLAGQQVPIGASVGVCAVGPEHSTVAHYPAAVIRDADSALRRAKSRGKGRVEPYDAALRNDAAQRMTDETDLAEAIAAGMLVVHYQPIVDLASGAAVGAEALVRWPRPGRGIVPPDRFIPLAEDSGLIVELGRSVLMQACRDAARWGIDVPALGAGSVSVNVSTRQLVHPRFPRDVAQALTSSGLPAARLTLEITESALADDATTVVRVLEDLRGQGISIALDDFGTGYSSLAYVQLLPVDILKIDKSFVDPIRGPGQGTTLSEVVLKLAEATGLRTVAEGIETPAQAEALRLLGCVSGQGYTWSRPVPIGQLATALPPARARLPAQR